MHKGENRVNQTDYGMPIYNLQHMLRTIFQTNQMEPKVIPDGFFNATTEQAVKNFQTWKNLDSNGVVDNETWDLIVEAYDLAIIEGNEPISVQLFTREDFMKNPGEKGARYAVLQAMLQVMHQRFDNLPDVEITGVNDARTNAALDKYRTLFGLTGGNGMDNLLWYHFVKAYESSVLPHDFEVPENNRFKPEEARQQPDTSMRGENSMPDTLPEENVLRMPTDADLMQQEAQINRVPMLDSYQSIRRARAEEDVQEENVSAAEPVQTKSETQRNMSRNRPPLKWNF